MSNIEISQAELTEAIILKDISVSAFKDNFEKYGHYPPGIASLDWHQDKIKNGIHYKIKYCGNFVGGAYLTLHPDNEMKIDFLFLNPDYQGKKIGTEVMAQLEEMHKDIRKWFLFTPYKDFRNHNFYGKLGYNKVGEITPNENSDFKLFKYEKKK